MIKWLLVAVALLVGCSAPSSATPLLARPVVTPICSIQPGNKADKHCTPGALNPDVTQANIADTICKPGWTATVRPPKYYTSSLKVKQMRQYGLTGPTSGYEEDHLVPLELGGAPQDPNNLWPEPVAHAKDLQENALKRDVCASPARATLAQARDRIIADWAK